MKRLGKDCKSMINRCDTGIDGSQKLDRELSDALIAISVVSRRIADRISIVSAGEKANMKGDDTNEESKRIVYAHS